MILRRKILYLVIVLLEITQNIERHEKLREKEREREREVECARRNWRQKGLY